MKDLFEIFQDPHFYELDRKAPEEGRSLLTDIFDRRRSQFTKSLKNGERCKECGAIINPNVGCVCKLFNKNLQRTSRSSLRWEDFMKETKVDEIAHEIWAAAQLMPGEGIEDGVKRVTGILGEKYKKAAQQDVEDGCEKCNDFYKSIYHNYCSNCGRVLPERTA